MDSWLLLQILVLVVLPRQQALLLHPPLDRSPNFIRFMNDLNRKDMESNLPNFWP